MPLACIGDSASGRRGAGIARGTGVGPAEFVGGVVGVAGGGPARGLAAAVAIGIVGVGVAGPRPRRHAGSGHPVQGVIGIAVGVVGHRVVLDRGLAILGVLGADVVGVGEAGQGRGVLVLPDHAQYVAGVVVGGVEGGSTGEGRLGSVIVGVIVGGGALGMRFQQ